MEEIVLVDVRQRVLRHALQHVNQVVARQAVNRYVKANVVNHAPVVLPDAGVIVKVIVMDAVVVVLVVVVGALILAQGAGATAEENAPVDAKVAVVVQVIVARHAAQNVKVVETVVVHNALVALDALTAHHVIRHVLMVVRAVVVNVIQPVQEDVQIHV